MWINEILDNNFCKGNIFWLRNQKIGIKKRPSGRFKN